MNDCTHKTIKCMDCLRYIQGDPEPVVVKAITEPDPNGYYPATCKSSKVPHREGFCITKGPLIVEVDFTPTGVAIGIWDATDEESTTLTVCGSEFDDCLDPYHESLVENKQQSELPQLFDERNPPPMTDEELTAYELSQIPIR